jgi:hypothetical protein
MAMRKPPEQIEIIVPRLSVKQEKLNERQQWCLDNIGYDGIHWWSRNAIGDYNSIAYYFVDEKDATMFALRWKV